jgi:hypothetical protein
MKLGELIRIVSQLSRNDQETCMVLADMLDRGIIKFTGPMRHHKFTIR